MYELGQVLNYKMGMKYSHLRSVALQMKAPLNVNTDFHMSFLRSGWSRSLLSAPPWSPAVYPPPAPTLLSDT